MGILGTKKVVCSDQIAAKATNLFPEAKARIKASRDEIVKVREGRLSLLNDLEAQVKTLQGEIAKDTANIDRLDLADKNLDELVLI